MAFTVKQITDATRQTYEHVNETEYDGRLPAWGVFDFKVTNTIRSLGCVRARPVLRQICSMHISQRLTTLESLALTVRHEIAHVASIIIDGESGHGPSFKRHALKCGTSPETCADRETSMLVYTQAPHQMRCQTGCDWAYGTTKFTKRMKYAQLGLLCCPKCKQPVKYVKG